MKIKHCLLINISGLGDIISSLVVAQSLVQKSYKVSFLIPKSFAGLLEHTEYQEIYSVNSTILYDLSIDLTSSKNSRKIFSKVKSVSKIALYKNLRQKIRFCFFYDILIKKNLHNHIIKNFYPIISYLNTPSVLEPKINFSKIKQENIVAIHIGARSKTREIPIKLLIKTIFYLKEKNIQVRLIGTEKTIAQNIIENCSNYPIYESASIKDVQTWLAQSCFVIAPDSGILHLAAALGKNCIGLYGPNLFSISGPLSKKVLPIELDFACRPCNQNKICSLDNKCMNDIKFAQVKERIDDIINKTNIF